MGSVWELEQSVHIIYVLTYIHCAICVRSRNPHPCQNNLIQFTPALI